MALVRKSLSTSLLNAYEKGSNELLEEDFHVIDEFAFLPQRVKENEETGEAIKVNDDMLCFSVKDIPETYFWASTGLYDFLLDQIEAYENNPEKIPEVKYNEERKTYYFDKDEKGNPVEVPIKHGGKVQLKSDKTKSCNTWIINI